MEKKDGDQSPVTNLKSLNFVVPYELFKTESLNSLQFLLKKRDNIAKLDLKDAYFCVPLHKESQKFVQFQCDGEGHVNKWSNQKGGGVNQGRSHLLFFNI